MSNLIYRVQGVPLSWTEAHLTEKLCENLQDDELSSHLEIKIAPYCYDDRESFIALLFCNGKPPRFLQCLTQSPLEALGLVFLDGNGGRTDIEIDGTFRGLTQLYPNPKNNPILADIIAITGIGSHAFGSWRAKDPRRRMWLHDFLQDDEVLKHCRTMIYGYDASLRSPDISSILDYSKNLVGELTKARAKARRRPLLFVGHSFGGFLAARALNIAFTAKEHKDELSDIFLSTYGFVFFGTPHKGLDVDSMKNLSGVAREWRERLLDSMSLKSHNLRDQLQIFQDAIGDRQVVSFYEVHATHSLEENENIWSRKGKYELPVDQDSCLLGLRQEHSEACSANHSTMVKFSNKYDTSYTTARDWLINFAENAGHVIPKRFKAPGMPVVKAGTTVPFARDDKFVERKVIFDNIDRVFAISPYYKRVALHGLGGIGKSQIAIEYSYRMRELHPEIWIFWVFASSKMRVVQSFRQMATSLALPGHDSPKADIFELVKQWLDNERNGQWLLIFDNADYEEVFFESLQDGADPNIPAVNKSRSLHSYIPQKTHGRILITSRNRETARSLVGDSEMLVKIEGMSANESMNLLRTKTLILSSDEQDAEELLTALDYVPLAITQAGAYLHQQRSLITIAEYLVEFSESDAN